MSQAASAEPVVSFNGWQLHVFEGWLGKTPDEQEARAKLLTDAISKFADNVSYNVQGSTTRPDSPGKVYNFRFDITGTIDEVTNKINGLNDAVAGLVENSKSYSGTIYVELPTTVGPRKVKIESEGQNISLETGLLHLFDVIEKYPESGALAEPIEHSRESYRQRDIKDRESMGVPKSSFCGAHNKLFGDHTTEELDQDIDAGIEGLRGEELDTQMCLRHNKIRGEHNENEWNEDKAANWIGVTLSPEDRVATEKLVLELAKEYFTKILPTKTAPEDIAWFENNIATMPDVTLEHWVESFRTAKGTLGEEQPAGLYKSQPPAGPYSLHYPVSTEQPVSVDPPTVENEEHHGIPWEHSGADPKAKLYFEDLVDCPICDGRKEIDIGIRDPSVGWDSVEVKCPYCEGAGKVDTSAVLVDEGFNLPLDDHDKPVSRDQWLDDFFALHELAHDRLGHYYIIDREPPEAEIDEIPDEEPPPEEIGPDEQQEWEDYERTSAGGGAGPEAVEYDDDSGEDKFEANPDNMIICPVCEGKGKIESDPMGHTEWEKIDQKCSMCNGAGVVPQSKIDEIAASPPMVWQCHECGKVFGTTDKDFDVGTEHIRVEHNRPFGSGHEYPVATRHPELWPEEKLEEKLSPEIEAAFVEAMEAELPMEDITSIFNISPSTAHRWAMERGLKPREAGKWGNPAPREIPDEELTPRAKELVDKYRKAPKEEAKCPVHQKSYSEHSRDENDEDAALDSIFPSKSEDGVDETEHEFRYEVMPVDKFDDFRYLKDEMEKGVSAIIGFKDKGKDKYSKIQALRFDKEKFKTKNDVQGWLKEHKEELEELKKEEATELPYYAFSPQRLSDMADQMEAMIPLIQQRGHALPEEVRTLQKFELELKSIMKESILAQPQKEAIETLLNLAQELMDFDSDTIASKLRDPDESYEHIHGVRKNPAVERPSEPQPEVVKCPYCSYRVIGGTQEDIDKHITEKGPEHTKPPEPIESEPELRQPETL
jgi:hypothetical protein